MTGVTVAEFEALLEQVEPRFAGQQRARAERKRAPGGGAKARYAVRERLLMTLIWLRLYVTCEAMGVLFAVDKSTVSRYTGPILAILRDLGWETLGWPTEAQDLVGQSGEPPSGPDPGTGEPPGGVGAPAPESSPGRAAGDLVAIIDATEQRVHRSQHYATQKAHYSGKKKAHTRKTQVVVNERGRIRDISASVPGAMHDLTLCRESKLAERLPPDISVMGDSGYQGLQDDLPNHSVALPYRASRGHPLSAEQKLHNHEISRIRIVVENTIAEVKHFHVLADVFRHARQAYDSVMLAVAGIINRRIDRRLVALGLA